MSTIDPRLSTTLPPSFDALERQARLDGGLDPVLAELEGADEALLASSDGATDSQALSLAAEGSPVFDIADQRSALAAMDRGDAVEQGVDDILAWA